VVGAGAVLLRVITGVAFANYDTLYALVWGQQLSSGEDPQYAIPIAPTPHPLVEALGAVLGPLGPRTATDVTLWLAYLALSTCGYLVYRLGTQWFNRPAGLVAALVLLTRTPILSYGSRAYIDIPFVALMLGAMLMESRRARAGAPVLLLLAFAGLLRPEAWVFSGLYWLYLSAGGRVQWDRRARRLRRVQIAVTAVASEPTPAGSAGEHRTLVLRTPSQLAWLAALGLLGPLVWIISDLAVTGNAMWSLTHTKQTAETLDRETGLAKVPEYIPRRIGEIMRPVALAGAALGGMLSLLWLPSRARVGAVVGVVALLVFAALAAFGLPIDTRYAFLAATLLCIFFGAGAFGWMSLPGSGRRRRAWALGGGIVLVALAASIPGQYHSVHTQLENLARQQRIQNDLVALVKDGQITTQCGAIGAPNHAPIPLLALWLKVPPGRVVSAEVQQITQGTYVQAADAEVRDDYVLDPHEPRKQTPAVPPGFMRTGGNRSWLIYQRCP
jgi:hypothetical protein